MKLSTTQFPIYKKLKLLDLQKTIAFFTRNIFNGTPLMHKK